MTESKLLKNLPSNEVSMVEYKRLNGDIYKITRNQTNKMFTIYKVVDGCFERLGKGDNPIVLEKKYIKN